MLIKVLARRILSTALIAMLALACAHAQTSDDPRKDNDPIVIPAGQTELVYRQPEELPRQLRAMLRGCTYEHWLAHFPIRVFRPAANQAPIAIAPCGMIINQGIAFRIGPWWQPEPISFVVMVPGGFTVDRNPGHLEWNPDTATLTAMQVSDVCPSGEVHHSYRYRGPASFTLIKVERRPGCGSAEPWTILFEPVDRPNRK